MKNIVMPPKMEECTGGREIGPCSMVVLIGDGCSCSNGGLAKKPRGLGTWTRKGIMSNDDGSPPTTFTISSHIHFTGEMWLYAGRV
jgi:hypothetical protein